MFVVFQKNTAHAFGHLIPDLGTLSTLCCTNIWMATIWFAVQSSASRHVPRAGVMFDIKAAKGMFFFLLFSHAKMRLQVLFDSGASPLQHWWEIKQLLPQSKSGFGAEAVWVTLIPLRVCACVRVRVCTCVCVHPSIHPSIYSKLLSNAAVKKSPKTLSQEQ